MTTIYTVTPPAQQTATITSTTTSNACLPNKVLTTTGINSYPIYGGGATTIGPWNTITSPFDEWQTPVKSLDFDSFAELLINMAEFQAVIEKSNNKALKESFDNYIDNFLKIIEKELQINGIGAYGLQLEPIMGYFNYPTSISIDINTIR